MVIVFEAQVALTPAGNPLAPDIPELEIPVAPVVVIVMLVKALLIHKVGVDEGEPAVLVALIVRTPLELATPSTAGELLTTLIRYPLPVEVPEGMVTEILWLPLASETTVCKSVADTKEPEASESCALKVQLPPLGKFAGAE